MCREANFTEEHFELFYNALKYSQTGGVPPVIFGMRSLMSK